MNGNESMTEYPEKLTGGYYRVKLHEEQLGQFRILSKAKALCDGNGGSCVYAPDGTAIYPTAVITEGTLAAETENTDAAERTEIVETTDIAEPAETTEPKEEESEPIAYAILRTLMNIRKEPSVEAEGITTYRRGTILKVLEVREDGWLKFICPDSPTGYAYVSNAGGEYAFLGHSIYTVQPEDNLFKIAEKTMGSGTKAAQIRETNLLTSNQIRVGMILIIP